MYTGVAFPEFYGKSDVSFGIGLCIFSSSPAHVVPPTDISALVMLHFHGTWTTASFPSRLELSPSVVSRGLDSKPRGSPCAIDRSDEYSAGML